MLSYNCWALLRFDKIAFVLLLTKLKQPSFHKGKHYQTNTFYYRKLWGEITYVFLGGGSLSNQISKTRLYCICKLTNLFV